MNLEWEIKLKFALEIFSLVFSSTEKKDDTCREHSRHPDEKRTQATIHSSSQGRSEDRSESTHQNNPLYHKTLTEMNTESLNNVLKKKNIPKCPNKMKIQLHLYLVMSNSSFGSQFKHHQLREAFSESHC